MIEQPGESLRRRSAKRLSRHRCQQVATKIHADASASEYRWGLRSGTLIAKRPSGGFTGLDHCACGVRVVKQESMIPVQSPKILEIVKPGGFENKLDPSK